MRIITEKASGAIFVSLSLKSFIFVTKPTLWNVQVSTESILMMITEKTIADIWKWTRIQDARIKSQIVTFKMICNLFVTFCIFCN